MKKIIAILCVISLLLVSTVGVVAAESGISISITDVKNDIVTVSGTAPNDTMVSVRIYNPGKSGSDINNTAGVTDTAAIQFFGTVLSKGGTFSLQVPINTQNGGLFTAEVSVNGTVATDTFTFYPYSKKVEYVTTMKNATNATALATEIPQIVEIYGYTDHPLCKATAAAAIAEAVVASNKDVSLSTPTDADAFLKQVLVLTAYQAKNEALLFKNNMMQYADMLGIADTDWYKDYAKSILSAEGLSGVKSDMMAASYTKVSDVYDTFAKSMCYRAVMNNTLSGGGHVNGLLTKYSTDYKNAGFNLDLLQTATGQNALFNSLVSSDTVTNLSALSTQFNTLFGGSENNGGSTTTPGTGTVVGGGGFGGGGGGLGAASGDNLYIEPDKTDENQTTTVSYPFADMASAEWAKDAVKALYDQKIVNGKSATEFAPQDAVTRAEFVKMIAEAFGVTAGETEVAFADVADDAWYAPYIKRVASAGIINGDGVNFSPDGLITRQDAAVIVARALNLASENAPAFSDAAEIADYAASAVAALNENSLMNGMGDGLFAPNANLTRAEAAQLIYNILQGGVLN